jgi:hypothetical protein
MRTILLTQSVLLLVSSVGVTNRVNIWIVHTLFVRVSVRFTDICLRVSCYFLLSGYQHNLPEDETSISRGFGGRKVYKIWNESSKSLSSYTSHSLVSFVGTYTHMYVFVYYNPSSWWNTARRLVRKDTKFEKLSSFSISHFLEVMDRT